MRLPHRSHNNIRLWPNTAMSVYFDSHEDQSCKKQKTDQRATQSRSVDTSRQPRPHDLIDATYCVIQYCASCKHQRLSVSIKALHAHFTLLEPLSTSLNLFCQFHNFRFTLKAGAYRGKCPSVVALLAPVRVLAGLANSTINNHHVELP